MGTPTTKLAFPIFRDELAGLEWSWKAEIHSNAEAPTYARSKHFDISDREIDIGKKVVIIAGEIFPDYERAIAEKEIEADEAYCRQFGDFGHYPGSWKDYAMDYQVWRVARVLGADFAETFWTKGCKIDSTDPDNVFVDFSFIYVDGEWEDGQHYELRTIPLGTAEEYYRFSGKEIPQSTRKEKPAQAAIENHLVLLRYKQYKPVYLEVMERC